ncbi:hypothetical protein [Leptotrichia sp. oral taxon 223]|nr:hypothetical protein [Leptotrichia sp. oral taxon 223]NWO19102.1 hypothetical protein [Leptotrichia sp. oral taxon 223]
MEDECKQLEQLKKIVQKYYKKEDFQDFIMKLNQEIVDELVKKNLMEA